MARFVKKIRIYILFFRQASGYCSPIYSATWCVSCRFDLILPPNSSMLMPGEHTTTRLTLVKRMPVMIGQAFTIRENNSSIATGIITKILPSLDVDKRKLNNVVVPGLPR